MKLLLQGPRLSNVQQLNGLSLNTIAIGINNKDTILNSIAVKTQRGSE